MEKIIEKIKKLEEFVAQNDLVQDAVALKSEYGVDKAEDLQKTLLEQESKDRVLRIGILGRVKAGKSSFLNALVFDGNDILPKAATPMTAALTILEYGDSTSAEVDFYTQEDLDGIKNEHKQYQELIDRIAMQRVKDLQENEEKAKTIAIQEAKKNERLFSSYDQYERILRSGIGDISQLNQYKNIQANNIDDLKNKLKDFVASDGKFMPFTKSVTLRLNNESLKDLQIIDSPGINDPVASRGERTRELLKDCDVCFLISPSGQFLSAEDMDLLDRLTVREGVQEFYVVASQVDSQLLGSCRDDANGVLSIALQKVEDALSTHMRSTFAQQKQNYPADFSKSVLLRFDKLMSHPVICTSGMAFSLLKNWDNQSQWNEELAFVFGNLEAEYQDFFSNPDMAKSNLEKIANIEKIKEVIQEVRNRKDEIQKAKQEEFLNVKNRGLQDYKIELLKKLKEKEKKLQESDLGKIEKEKENILKVQAHGSSVLDDYYFDTTTELESQIKLALDSNIRSFFRESEQVVKDSEETHTETISYEVSTGEKSWWKPWTWFGDNKETRYRTTTTTTVQAGAIRSSLDDLIYDITNLLDTKCQSILRDWKNKFSKEIVSVLRKEIGDEFIDDIAMLQRIIREVANSIVYPDVDLGGIPDGLKKTGTIYDDEAREFMRIAEDFLAKFKTKVRNDTKNYTNLLISKLREVNLSNRVFGKYNDEIVRLESEIQNKQSNLDRYKTMIQTLEKI